MAPSSQVHGDHALDPEDRVVLKTLLTATQQCACASRSHRGHKALRRRVTKTPLWWSCHRKRDTTMSTLKNKIAIVTHFTNPEIIGRFLFHCHVAKHEDKGMMMSIEVKRPGAH